MKHAKVAASVATICVLLSPTAASAAVEQPGPTATAAKAEVVAGDWWTKCYVMTLSGAGTDAVVYGVGRDRASAQNKANTFVPSGYRAKHCSDRSVPVDRIPSAVVKNGGGLVGSLG